LDKTKVSLFLWRHSRAGALLFGYQWSEVRHQVSGIRKATTLRTSAKACFHLKVSKKRVSLRGAKRRGNPGKLKRIKLFLALPITAFCKGSCRSRPAGAPLSCADKKVGKETAPGSAALRVPCTSHRRGRSRYQMTEIRIQESVKAFLANDEM